MFVLAHLAAGYVVGRVWNHAFRRHNVNVAWTTLGGILPDLIDKPLSYLPAWQGGRTVAHSLLFLVLLVALARIHVGFGALALGAATHLLLDDPTTYLTTLAWPFLGLQFTPDEDMSLAALQRHLAKPRTGLAEIAGGTVLFAVTLEHAWSRIRNRRAPRTVNHGAEARAGSVGLQHVATPVSAESD